MPKIKEKHYKIIQGLYIRGAAYTLEEARKKANELEVNFYSYPAKITIWKKVEDVKR